MTKGLVHACWTAIAALAVAQGTAQAAAWSDPVRVPVGTADGFVGCGYSPDDCDLAVAGSGAAAAFGPVIGPSAGGNPANLALIDPGGQSRAFTYPLGSVIGASVAVADSGRLAVAWISDSDDGRVIAFASGTVGRPPDTARTLWRPSGRVYIDPSKIALVQAEDGTAVVGWVEQHRGSSPRSTVRVATISPAGRVIRIGALSAPRTSNWGLALALDRRRRVTATWWQGRAFEGPLTLMTRIGNLRGRWGAAQRRRFPRSEVLGDRRAVPGGEVLTDRDGNQYLFGTRTHRRGRVSIRSAYRRAGRSFGRLRTIARVPRATEESYAVGPGGRAALLYAAELPPQFDRSQEVLDAARGSLRARLAAPGGRWGPVQRLGSADRIPGPPAVAVDPRGRAVALWAEGADAETAELVAAGAGPRGRFRSTVPPRVPPQRWRSAAPLLRLSSSGRGAALLTLGNAESVLFYRP